MRISDWSSDVCSSDLMSWLTMAWRTAGRLGWGGGPSVLFSPFRLAETPVLKEGIGDHRQERMAVQAHPGAPLEVVEPELLLHLLMRLLAHPAQIGRAHV